MEATRDQQDRIVSTGERPVLPENAVDQLHLPKDERVVSANPSPDAIIIGPSRDAQEQTGVADPGGYFSIIHAPSNLSPYEWDATHGGYGSWDGYPQYANPEGLHVPSVIYNENPSLMFHSGFGFNPLPPIMLEGQIYSPQQIPFSPSYYPQPAPFDVSSAMPISPSELVTSKSNGDSLLFDPGSGYVMPFGSYGGVNFSGNLGTSPLPSPVAYPQTMSILGSYEQNTGQLPLHGYAFASSSFGGYPHTEPYQSPNSTSSSVPYLGADGRVRLTSDKGKRRERDQDSISVTSDSHGNRGPRASRVRGKNPCEPSSSTANEKNTSAASGPNTSLYNRPDFETDYKNAKFFIIKSFSEDNVHKSVKYNVWASTPHGNKKLDAAYHEAKEMDANCPVFLFFSVNASGQFCGVAEMVGPVNFEKDAEYWLQDRWSGQFPVKWHIIKDVPNSRFRHILLQNNDNKPVTHSRDCQEVKAEHGIEMLKIFKAYGAHTSLLDDFAYYNEREKALVERKLGEQATSTTKDAPTTNADDSLSQISDRLTQALTLEDGDEKKQGNESNSSLRRESIEGSPRSTSPSIKSEVKSSSAETAGDKQN